MSDVVNPHPQQRIRVHSPAPSNPHIQPTEALRLPFTDVPLLLASDTRQPILAPRRERPIFIDRLTSNAISSWQIDIRARLSQVVGPSQEVEIKAASAEKLAQFVIIALKLLVQKAPVPTADLQLGIENAKIDSTYSFFYRYPRFET